MYLTFDFGASVAADAVVYFLATEAPRTPAAGLEVLQSARKSELQFPAGISQRGKLVICESDLDAALSGFEAASGKHELVLDLRANGVANDEQNCVSVQRSILKFSEHRDSIQVASQLVQVGNLVRTLDALYGMMPNPRLGNVVPDDGDLEGGDCVICLSKPREVAILHCRHICLCLSCAQITSSTWSFACPVCRGRVAAMIGIGDSPA